MTTTRDLLGVIAELRERLDQASDLANDAGDAATHLHDAENPIRILQQRIQLGTEQQRALSQAFRQSGYSTSHSGEQGFPPQLTARAVRLLRSAKEILAKLKSHANDPLLDQGDGQPLGTFYQDGVLLAELVFRLLQTMPSEPSAQLQLCSGLDVLISTLQQRLTGIEDTLRAIHHRRRTAHQLENLLQKVIDGKLSTLNPFYSLAETVIEDCHRGSPLLFPEQLPDEVGQFVSQHSLAVAKTVVYFGQMAPQWRDALLQPVVAALLHDVGMLSIPNETLRTPEEFHITQMGVIEKHCRIGASAVGALRGCETWLLEAIRSHHERLDGTGYPAGLPGSQIGQMARLLAACDVYVALCSHRPHRAAIEPALAIDKLHEMTERGKLDSIYVDAVASFGTYPPGLGIELNDGTCGVVILPPQSPSEIHEVGPRPVVEILTHSDHAPRQTPQVIDLMACQSLKISRVLSGPEKRALFAGSYPQWA
ncbi:MAG: HD-GYP domain-containing protein [Gemmataceae bacterium]